ncbi:MAG TPA: D-2-hydroxyacid dehydrogenase [Candidatus Binatia bacterium]|jgi:glycerate dehydrogenase
MNPAEPRIVFLDAATYGDASLRVFTERWPCTIHELTAPAEVAARLAGHSVAVTNKVVLDGGILRAPEAQNLRLIAVAATGTDIIDRHTASQLGIRVSNVPGYAAQSVAQFTMALILELAAGVGRYAQAVREGAWEKSPTFALFTFPTTELHGKTLGIVGYGNIGRAVALMAEAFGMNILIAARPGSLASNNSERVSIEELFRTSDIISLHCPLTPETKELVNEQTLSWMKPTAFLINTARGALISEAALIKALREHRIAAAALDVISREPPPAHHPITEAARKLDNLLITPHTAWTARESRERLLNEVAENISAFLRDEPKNIVA